MADGQVGSKEINSQSGSEKSSVQELQSVLHSQRFKETSNAYRILEMTGRHSRNLFGYFPDSQGEIVGTVEPARELNEEEWEKGFVEYGFDEKDKDKMREEVLERFRQYKPSLRLDNKQKEKLTTMINSGRDLVTDAHLYVCAQNYPLSPENIWFNAGHPLVESPTPVSLDPLKTTKKELEDNGYASSSRGLFIRMAGKFSGTVVMLLDPGGSRWLYDWYSAQGEKDKFALAMISALKSNKHCQWGRWINDRDNRPDSKLVIVDHDYNIEKVIPFK